MTIWRIEDDSAVLFLKKYGYRNEEIGLRLDRTAKAVQHRLKRIKSSSHVSSRVAEIRRLREENLALREQITELLTWATPPQAIVFPMEWKLSRSEGWILRMILVQPIAMYERIASVLYDGQLRDAPGQRVIYVTTAHLRKKLARAGVRVSIRVKWGEGFWMTEGDKERLRGAMRGYGKADKPLLPKDIGRPT